MHILDKKIRFLEVVGIIDKNLEMTQTLFLLQDW